MKDIASMLKRQSPTPQLPSYGNGCIELPNGKRWNPLHIHKFNTNPLPLWRRLFKFLGGVHAF
ncbi:phage filamentation protein Fil family protein [Kosakonia cowanii]|uniref:phage filamentation protein Fil family protein n=1 Tax=Kosakonia cowanii TaxID=208223 RepID=UPI0029C7349D|nr:phage filamentation protein Fil family protein [Kosakonia cowanii]WPG22226.1 phage filamentation protein Fil family protein [Kosakonia cowanii]